ncbi:MAG: hypothetical protein Q9160_005328 [Pyrenula sp. 1 TL-2023]
MPPKKTPTDDSAPPPLTQAHSTQNVYERQFGYHRAVRKGPFIFVSGTTALINGTKQVRLKGNARGQAVAAMEEAVKAVEALGGTKQGIGRVRMFVNGAEHTTAVGRALKAVFSDVEVAATMIVVPNGFVDPDMMVEIELDAVVG